jgi:hypothetical protein
MEAPPRRRIRPSTSALLEVALVAFVYIATAHLVARLLDLRAVLPGDLDAHERSVGGVFLAGAIAQTAMVLLFLGLRHPDFREAAKQTLQPATREGWTVAAIATAIHLGTAAAFFVPAPSDIVELSSRNLILSLAAAPDGWAQEMVFRGYVLYRLERARFPPGLRIVVSGAAFSAIHLGYVGAGFAGAFWPLLGTFVLGAFFAWSVSLSKRSLKPVVCCHVLLIILVQPWLALGR